MPAKCLLNAANVSGFFGISQNSHNPSVSIPKHVLASPIFFVRFYYTKVTLIRDAVSSIFNCYIGVCIFYE